MDDQGEKSENKRKTISQRGMNNIFRIFSVVAEGPTQITVPDSDLYDPDDQISWEVTAERPNPVMKIIPFQKIVDQRYLRLKIKHGYGGKSTAFEELRQQLIDEGRDPEKYGLKHDVYNFDQNVRNRNNQY